MSAVFAVLAISACVGSASVRASASEAACTYIASDLSYGSSGAAVSALQAFLSDMGYLHAAPNGRFGPATRAAVKAFQIAHDIAATGKIARRTRAAITDLQARTCPSAGAAGGTTTVIDALPSPAPAPSSTSSVLNIPVVSPATGQVLSIGSSTVIRWTASPSAIYNISLERPGGAGAGFIALGQTPTGGGSGQYLWRVGKVFSSQSNSNQVVSAGTYRIRLQGASSGASTADQTSGWFTIVASQFAARSVSPSSAPADNATSVALFGSGFTSATSVYFDADLSGIRANNAYVSPDGTLLVFTVPASVPAGAHTLYVHDANSSSPVSLPFSVADIR